jgi:hypothetical protein
MADESIHELSAAYALDALDADGQAEYEAHLAGCERCREEVASLVAAATALAYVPEGPAPPPPLRERILAAAARERPNVVPIHRRRPFQLVAAAAAVAAGVAIGFGVWAGSLNDRLGHSQRLSASRADILAIAANPASRHVPLQGGTGTLLVDPAGHAALVVSRMSSVPSGKTYEAWVIVGKSARPAGLFRGGGGTTAVRLTRTVPRGALVGVTRERAGGVDAPTQPPFITAHA